MWNRARISVAFSVLAHAALVALLLYFKSTATPPTSAQIEIELLPPQPLSPTSRRSQAHSQSPSPATATPTTETPILSRQQLSPSPITTDARQSDPSLAQNQIISDGWSDTDFGTRGGSFKEIEHFASYNRVLEEVRGMLEYPAVLALNGVGGTINARLHFKNAHCDWDRSTVFNGERHLRFYITHMLRKLCGLETIDRLAFKDSQFLDLTFTFLLNHEPLSRGRQEASDRITGNVLSFERSFRPPDLSNLDVAWFERKWETYVQGLDPMRTFSSSH